MKTPLMVTLPAILLAAAFLHPGLVAIRQVQAVAEIAAQDSGTAAALEITQTVIEPGASVGPLKLGDSRARALELFPRKYEDQEWEDQCGTTLNWVDVANRVVRGDVAIHVKNDKVFEIESATTRFHTAEGITTFDPPERIRNSYKDMMAFTLLTPPTPALGDRPLVFWIDRKKGIAFAFAYYPAKQQRYLYKIIVFVPNKTFCPEGETTNSPKWQQIDPYSLEPPRDLAVVLH